MAQKSAKQKHRLIEEKTMKRAACSREPQRYVVVDSRGRKKKEEGKRCVYKVVVVVCLERIV
jgi:hypothetical protein